MHDAIADRAQQYLSEPTRPWRAPGTHVEAMEAHVHSLPVPTPREASSLRPSLRTDCAAFAPMKTMLLFASLASSAVAQTTNVKCVTTAGSFTAVVERSNSPQGVDRFLELVSSGFFTDMLLYRVIPGFLIQFGVAADPKVQAKWQNDKLPDEPNLHKFRGGTLSYAGAGADSRSCHLFVALAPNGARLGNAKHETTLGHITEVEVFEKVADNFKASGYPDSRQPAGRACGLSRRATPPRPSTRSLTRSSRAP